MKKVLLILIMFIAFTQETKADVCVYINKDVAEKAVDIIKSYDEVINYCSRCDDARPVSEKVETIEIKKIGNPKDKYFSVSINGERKDIAYLYIKDNKTYKNLASLSGCNDIKKLNLKANITNLPVKIKQSRIELKPSINKETDEIVNGCVKKFFVEDNLTTAQMVQYSSLANDCIAEKIKKQIMEGFEKPEQEKMLIALQELRKSSFQFYDMIYNSNKYCIGQCGTIAHPMAFEDEKKQLRNMLKALIYLNKAKNGY